MALGSNERRCRSPAHVGAERVLTVLNAAAELPPSEPPSSSPSSSPTALIARAAEGMAATMLSNWRRRARGGRAPRRAAVGREGAHMARKSAGPFAAAPFAAAAFALHGALGAVLEKRPCGFVWRAETNPPTNWTFDLAALRNTTLAANTSSWQYSLGMCGEAVDACRPANCRKLGVP